jgi:hypothetical protein
MNATDFVLQSTSCDQGSDWGEASFLHFPSCSQI